MSRVDPPTVLRGVALSPQSVPTPVRASAPAAALQRSRRPEDLLPPRDMPSPSDIEADARQRGYREGWEQGYQEARVAAREAVLVQAESLIAEATEEARRVAQSQVSERLEVAARQRAHEQFARMDALLASMPEAIAQRMEAAEDDLLVLSAEVVVRLLGSAAVHGDAVRGAVMQALAQVRSRELVTIALHPDDLATLQALPDAQCWMQQQGPQIRWTASVDVPTGGCLMACADGTLDARLDTQLQVFTRLLRESREASRVPASDVARGKSVLP